eukprot:TRINITY_DN3831_c0_g1_i2.p1 TRINITY_DN3831_c0_g1~~TRINITY_DN3831_c0_g1_i2.p1  ORF type:complete len:316 (-),score=69.50 TRINITY_DN3831_c0_g1_i2:49-996(-)
MGIEIGKLEMIDKVKTDGSYMVQDYIKHPFLINNRKQSVRLYVLITSLDPLRMYIYNNGIVKFASEEYIDPFDEDNQGEINTNKYMHITNQALNKKQSKFTTVDSDAVEVYEGNRWNLKGWFTFMKNYFSQNGHDSEECEKKVNELWNTMKETVVKAILCSYKSMLDEAKRANVTDYRPFFQLFGTDVDLDRNLKVWYIESNVNPTTKSSAKFEYRDKLHMFTDMFNMLGLVNEVKDKYVTDIKQYLPREETDEWKNIIAESLYEHSTKGDWERVFPSPTSSLNDLYLSFIGEAGSSMTPKLFEKFNDEKYNGFF